MRRARGGPATLACVVGNGAGACELTTHAVGLLWRTHVQTRSEIRHLPVELTPKELPERQLELDVAERQQSFEDTDKRAH